MENKKEEFSITHSEQSSSAKILPRPILRRGTDIKTSSKFHSLKKSNTMNLISKSVSFPDKIKKPIHVIIEVEPIIYEEQPVEEKKKKNSKGCYCTIF